MNRRQYLRAIGTAGLFSAVGVALGQEPTASRRQTILLRSSWQTVNIGDIGHTPGVLALLEKHLPDVEVRLWPTDLRDGVKEMLQRRFPRVAVVETAGEIERALADCDFLLHGSGPFLVGKKQVAQWKHETGKPYGVYGITLPPEQIDEQVIALLSGARFVFFRDSGSLAVAKARGVTAPVMEFGPDGAFAVDVRDDARAEAFLAAHDLQPGQFLCCIPRYRRTPYWLIERKQRPVDPVAAELNERLVEHDHAPHREAIIQVVRQTKLKVLICPEDETQVKLGKEILYDKLPEDVRARVVWREKYWLTDEAVSTYVRSAGLFGNEMHSPIMALGNGVPAIVCRWDTQTSKGLMWRDIGLGDWLFDFDNEADVARLPSAVLALAQDSPGALSRVAKARAFVTERQSATMAILKRNAVV